MNNIYKKIYTKCSIERAPRYAIVTDILQAEDGSLLVRKRPYRREAQEHIDHMAKVCAQAEVIYRDSEFSYISCKKQDDAVDFEYVSGHTLEEIADSCIEKGDAEGAVKCIDKVVQWLYEYAEKKSSIMDDLFNSVFGAVDLPADTLCAGMGNIDLILSNIIVGDGYKVIDYEWTFDCAVPVQFIIYRILYSYIYGNERRLMAMQPYGLFEKYGISDADMEIFAGMERHFQAYIKGDTLSLGDVSTGIAHDIVPINEAIELQLAVIRHNTMHIYMDRGQGYKCESVVCQEGSAVYEGKRTLKLALEPGVRRVKIEPAMKTCVVCMEKCENEQNISCRVAFPAESTVLGDNIYILRPGYLYFEIDIPREKHWIDLEFSVWYLQDELLDKLQSAGSMPGSGNPVEQISVAGRIKRKLRSVIPAKNGSDTGT